MNFDTIKAKMDSENMDNVPIPSRIKDLESSKMPIQKVRKTMIGEIITQLIAIVFFFAVPSLVEMHKLPQGLYYILMFVTSIITLGYLAKMTWFLNKTSNLSKGSKESVITFINDLKLTLEVYKTAIISGSLLLPLAMATFILGMDYQDESIFTNLVLLQIPTTSLILYIFGYLALAIVLFFITVSWADRLYGTHIKELENTLKEFSS